MDMGKLVSNSGKRKIYFVLYLMEYQQKENRERLCMMYDVEENLAGRSRWAFVRKKVKLTFRCISEMHNII